MKFSKERSIEILERTPRVIQEFASGLSSDWTQPNYGEGTWPVHVVIGHLIWGERTDWIPRLRRMIEQDNPNLEPFDMKGHLALCNEKNSDELIEIFAAERAANVKALREIDLSDEALARTGVHPQLGLVTVSQHLSTWTTHDLGHIAQICRAMTYQYRDEVGPWRKYLSILK